MIRKSVAEVLDHHVTFELEAIDRMYLNLYVPGLQYAGGVVEFFRNRGLPFASGAVMAPITDAFVAAIKRFVDEQGVDLVRFSPGERKDDVAQDYLARFESEEGILFVGVAQEKTRMWTTEKRTNPDTGATYPWLVKTTRIPNHFYFYGVDRDFGLFFIKFSSYFPYNSKVLINGHHFAQRQAALAGVGFEALDNGFASCDDPDRLQRICDRLGPGAVKRFFWRWLHRLPCPFTTADFKAGYGYELAFRQFEISDTQVFDRPAAGRAFFEGVIRDHLDIGRPDQVALIFDRRLRHTHPAGSMKTRPIGFNTRLADVDSLLDCAPVECPPAAAEEAFPCFQPPREC